LNIFNAKKKKHKFFFVVLLFNNFLFKKFFKCKRQSFRFEHVDDSVRLPYIGGARGQVLEIRQRPDGTIFSRILMDDSKKDENDAVHYSKLANVKEEPNTFESNLHSIQQAAADLVGIQEIFKQQGKLSSEQKRKYTQSLEKLGVSAQRLANIQGTDDDIRTLLEG
jgi:hypothetical protein